MKSKSVYKILGTVIIISAGLQVYFGINESELIAKVLTPVLVACIVLFSTTHGIMRYGKKNMLIFFLITFVVSWIYENLSIFTGFPFGNYHYTEFLGVKLLHVPLAIMPAYFGTAYLAWTLAGILIDEYKNKLSGGSVFFVPVIASFIMVMWDVVFDPSAATIQQSWIWEDGGGFFGVPFSNYMGWFLCVFTIYQLFAVYLMKKKEFASHPIVSEKPYWILSAVMYSLAVFFVPFKALFASDLSVISQDNHQWWTGDIYTTSSLLLIFTMFFVSILAIIKSIRKENYEK
ncbi:MAG: carotenoid biosynthesis protein [Deltaproteobacteria bacterium]|nr:carotenoid biosynthesis protein [Deltaproteobacteria bacterium]